MSVLFFTCLLFSSSHCNSQSKPQHSNATHAHTPPHALVSVLLATPTHSTTTPTKIQIRQPRYQFNFNTSTSKRHRERKKQNSTGSGFALELLLLSSPCTRHAHGPAALFGSLLFSAHPQHPLCTLAPSFGRFCSSGQRSSAQFLARFGSVFSRLFNWTNSIGVALSHSLATTPRKQTTHRKHASIVPAHRTSRRK